jgi:hypothetical protein
MTHHTPAELEPIPAPAAAQHAGQWVDQDGDDMDWGRYVRGLRLNISGVPVTLCGWQDGTGAVDSHASMAAADNELDATARSCGPGARRRR